MLWLLLLGVVAFNLLGWLFYRHRRRIAHREQIIDQTIDDSFPASDPPSYSSGSIGAPKARESDSPAGDSHEVLEAEKKVKSGDAKKPETY